MEWLPKIAALLPREGFVPAKQGTLYSDPKMKGVAATTEAQITISADWARKSLGDIGWSFTN